MRKQKDIRMAKKIWLITGVSTGLGRAIAEAALGAGDIVVGTLRQEAERAAFSALAPGRAHSILLDVTDDKAIEPAVARIEKEVGPIDVLVNNAGYGHEGLLEESSMDEIRRQFEVNVFGAVAMMKAVLPRMRPRRKGWIFNISSMGGIVTFPGIGVYHGSKFALEGFSETTAKEVRPFGIYVVAVEPGGFRTDWAGRSMVRTARSIPDYDAIMNPARERRMKMSGNQAGDPKKAGAAILKVIASDNPPMHLLLGQDAWRLVHEKLDALKADFDAWKDVTHSTDFAS
jgi:NAD(P)-dependent dehydrogenase (short-subunit alcohol dehydrogenase family)